MNRISVFVEGAVACSSCDGPIHLNGLVDSVQCERCNHVLPMPLAIWQALIGEEIGLAAQMEEGTSKDITALKPVNARLTYGRRTARCHKCEAELIDGDPLAERIGCEKCGEQIVARPAPELAKQLNPSIVAIVGEVLSHSATPLDGVEPIGIHCIACGANLVADGSSRNVTCMHCEAQCFLPDQLWIKLHPVSVRKRWYVQLELGGAVAVLPDDSFMFGGIAYGPTDVPVVMYRDSSNVRVIDALDSTGRVAWRSKEVSQSDLMSMSEDAYLVVSPNGQYLAVVDPVDGFVQYLDANSGSLLWRAEAAAVNSGELAPDQLRPLEVESRGAVTLDADGTLVVLQNGDDESSPLLTRYAANGQPLAMWAQPHTASDWEQPNWDQLTHGALVPPYRAHMAVGNDGLLYIVDKRLIHMAAFDRNGQMVQNRALKTPEVDEVLAFGASSNGTLYVLVEMKGGGARSVAHLLSVSPGGDPAIIAGALAAAGPPLGKHDSRMAVAPSGICFVASALDSLRVIDGHGRLVWRSPSTTRSDG